MEPLSDSMIAEDSHLQQTQQLTQNVNAQYGSHWQLPGNIDAHLWGFLQPCTAALSRIDFWKVCPVYDIGRNKEGNNIVLPGFKVSECLVCIFAQFHPLNALNARSL